jgi:hypothetical protein
MGDRDELLRAFHILPEDLEANHTGALGPRQAQRLIAGGYWDLGAALIIGVALMAILLFVAHRPLKPVQWILSGALFLAALLVGINYFRRVRAAVAEGRVECLTGAVETRSRGRSGWYLHVAGQSFKLPVRPWQVKSGRTYRVYVAPRAGVIVAMEPDGWE